MISELMKINEVLKIENKTLGKTAEAYMNIVRDILAIDPIEVAGIAVVPVSKIAEIVENRLGTNFKKK